ncbi:hypothetical protein DdX_17703 [Ditylenchus destructor]|uniref:G-protein coupled receptors family 1 profile domain-containing protein n=1 Tax=Ditylenchus destructor TaxID=166010 RepID=A0AAD4MLM5_9BILA|nr:hypothetical protein DdX_17703 [Ditylenchus destructor]
MNENSILSTIHVSTLLIIWMLSTAANSAVLFAFYKVRRHVNGMPFYVITTNSIICNLLVLLTDFPLSLALAFLKYDLQSTSILINEIHPFFYMLGSFYAVYCIADILLGLLLAINRLFIFMAPVQSQRFIASIWLMTFGIVILYELTGCGIHLYYGYVCVRKYGPILMLFVYFCIYLKLKVQSKGLSAIAFSKKKQTKLFKKFADIIRRRETAFLLQCFFICAIYEVRYAAHEFSTLFATDETSRMVVQYLKNYVSYIATADGYLVDFVDTTVAGAVVKDIIARGRVKDIGMLQCDLPVRDGAEVDADVWMVPAWSV